MRDIEDKGPTPNVGNHAMRVTNVGILGNPFFHVGLSFDLPFEYACDTGPGCLNYTALWVGTHDERSGVGDLPVHRVLVARSPVRFVIIR